MNFILLSDVHATSLQPRGRKDDYAETVMNKLDYVYSFAERKKAVVLQAGDYVDRPRDWLMLPRLISLLKTYESVKTYMVIGQHDMYMRTRTTEDFRSTTIGLLQEMELVNIVRTATVGGVGISGAGWEEDEVVPKIAANATHKKRILIIHAPISMNKETGISTLGAKTFAKKHLAFDVILCGDIHKSFFYHTEGTTIVNTGPLVRKEATRYNMLHEPHFYLYDSRTGKFQKKMVPCEESKDVISRDHIDREAEINGIMNQFMEAVEATTGVNSSDVLVNLYMYMKRIKVSKEVKFIIERIIDAS